MSEQEEFFTKKHNRLLSIATWAKYLAWIVIVVFAILAFSEFIQGQYDYSYQFQRQAIFSEILEDQPLFALNTFLNTASVVLKGVICYLILRSIFLGLNMIVETDINYREYKKQDVENEK
jgi:hypothetical protein